MAESLTPVRRSSENTVYTTLLLIAVIVLIIGVGYVWYRDTQLSGSINPWGAQSTTTAMVDIVPGM